MGKARNRLIALSDIVRDRLVVVASPPKGFSVRGLTDAGARDILVLTRGADKNPARRGDHLVAPLRRSSDVARNNCTVAVLNGVTGLALLNKRAFAQFRHILVPRDASLLAAAGGLLRYGRRGHLRIVGRSLLETGTRAKTFLVLESNFKLASNCRLYAPSGPPPSELLRRISDLDCVILRSIEAIEAERHTGDLDLLISAEELDKLEERLGGQAGTYPLDVYTEAGERGHSYLSVPYFKPSLAREILSSAVLRPSGIRAPSVKWRYLAFCYHVLFHNKLAKVKPGQEALKPDLFRKRRHYDELIRLAQEAGLPPPASFGDLERALKTEDAFPGIDLIGFYSKKSPFAKERYLSGGAARPGLSVFFLRDFGERLSPVREVRERLASKFEVLVEGPVTPENEAAILGGVRGGNWEDRQAPGGVAKPVYWFVCWDGSPVAPSFSTRRKYPRIDNENIRLKDRIRREIGVASSKPQPIVHSSDNSTEALEHLQRLGLSSHPSIMALGLAEGKRG